MTTAAITKEQKRAIDALLQTYNLAEAACIAEVEFETLYGWIVQDIAFNAALSAIGAVRADEAFCTLMAELEWEWQES